MKIHLFLAGLLFSVQCIVPAATSVQRATRQMPLLQEFCEDPQAFGLSIHAVLGQPEYIERLLKGRAFLNELRANHADVPQILLHALENSYHVFNFLLLTNLELKDCVVGQRTVPGIREKLIDVYVTPVLQAVCKNKPKELALLLSVKADPNGMCSKGFTPLIQAIADHKNDLVNILLEGGADVLITRNDNASPLHIAVSAKNKAIIPELLSAGVDVDKQDDDGCTALSIALEKEQEEAAELLLAANANPNISRNDGTLPLHFAVHDKNTKIIQALVRAGADVNQQDKRGCSVLHRAVALGLNEVVSLLLELGANPNTLRNDGVSPLALAVQAGQVNIVRALLSAGAHPDTGPSTGCSALHMAAQKGYDEIVQLLLEYKANYTDARLSGAVNEPLSTATVQGHVDVIRRLLALDNIPLSVCADNNLSMWHFLGLSECADAGCIVDLFRPHVSRMSELNMQDAFGYYPIHYACCRIDVDLLQFMLSCGADIHVHNYYKETPLYIAALAGNLPTVQMLCSAGADTQAKNILGLKPIDIARVEGHKDVVKFLQQYKPSITTGASSAASSSQASSSVQDASMQEQSAASSSVPKKQAGLQATKAKGKRRNQRGQPVALDDVFTVIDAHKEQNTNEVFALRQPEQHMTVVVYKGAPYKLPRTSNVCNMSGESDKFHAFSARVDRCLNRGIYVDAKNRTEHAALLKDLGITGFKEFAIILPGKIESEQYDARYALIDKERITRGRSGAFVYLFDKNGTCYHRFFHENYESKQRNKF
jgi:ankyrin repeat protein